MFRRAMGRFVSGVTVVTTVDGGQALGCTVSSFCSLSENPPLVLVCVRRDRLMGFALSQAPAFTVNVLRQDHAELARRFASPFPNRFDGVPTTPGRHGIPILSDTIAAIECDRYEVVDGGDHVIVLGRVISTTLRDGEPLIYRDGELLSCPHTLPMSVPAPRVRYPLLPREHDGPR
jgi:flavin reductase (DIM6/NTAB) family NADH-FMN oxidoreductase RutF